MKKYIFLISALLLTFAFTGCGDEEKTSDIVGDYSELTDNDRSGLSDKLGITSDKLTKELTEVYLINADIEVPDSNQIGVYSLSETEIDRTFVNDAAKTIFDNGEYEEIIIQDVNTDELDETISSGENNNLSESLNQ